MMLDADLTVVLTDFELDAAFTAAPGEVVALLGPNGAGKTTALRAIAGLEHLAAGRVMLNGRTLSGDGVHEPAEDRGIGVVFQDHLLFPHLSALDNVAFGLRAAGTGRAEARTVAGAWLERVGLAGSGSAAPGSLSGGQARRVALARALATAPRLVLLDEPLAAIDVAARTTIRHDLAGHLKDLRVPCVLVTHDPLEAAMLADRIVVLEAGRVVQEGTLAEITRRPRSPWSARLVGTNLYRGRSVAGGVRVGDVVLAATDSPVGEVFAAVPPQAVTLHRRRPEGSARNVWRGRVTSIESLGSRVRVAIDAAVPVIAEITPASLSDLDLAAAGAVWVSVKAAEVEVYPA
jgi:molybdate transport system ATP-binding protein